MTVIALDLVILVPLFLAAVSLIAGRVSPNAPRWVALFGCLAQLGLLAALAPEGLFAGARVVGIKATAGGNVWGTVTDGLSTPLVVLTALIGVAAVSASWRVTHRPGQHFGLLLLLQAAVCAVFLADNLIMFYVAWESVLVPMFLLIGGWGSAGARRASMKFLIYTFAGGAVLLLGVIYIASFTNLTSIAAIARVADTIPMPALAFWLLAIGFLVKLPAVPVHTWLPDAHTEAPTAGSIVLAGVLLKMGGYGLIRIALPLAPLGFGPSRGILAALGVIGIVWGAATALVQSDLKRLVAYSSVAHMGFVLVAVAIATPQSLSAAVVTMVSHGLVAGMLFFLVGALYERAHTRELSRFGGLGTITPRWATAFVFASLASAGLPGLSGFPGELMTTLESFGPLGWWTLAIGFGIVLAAAYNLRAVRRTAQGPVGEFGELSDLGARETVTALAFAVAVIGLGIAPWIVSQGAMAAVSAVSRAVGGGA